MDHLNIEKSVFASKLPELVKKANSMRVHAKYPSDITFKQIVEREFKNPETQKPLTVDELYADLGVDPSFTTLENLFTTPSSDIRWLIPEIFRDALRLGYRQSPIWPNITAMEEATTGLTQILPSINMSDAAPKKLGEGETIPLGTLTYQSKKFSIHKFGRGIKLTDEVSRYVNLNVISIYFQDFGMKMGLGVDALAIDTLINGEQADGSYAAPVLGIKTPNTLTFRDILKPWIRMAHIGRTPKLILGDEDSALDTWDLDEFKVKSVGSTDYKLNIKTPLPQGADYYIHGNIPANQQLIVDPTASLIKLNAAPMMVESERIVSNQTEAFYASFTLGFAKLFIDACLILDQSKDFDSFGFPAGLNTYGFQNVDINSKK